MDSAIQFAVFVVLVTLIIFSLTFPGIRKRNTARKGKQAPEPYGAWPIISHLRLIVRSDKLLHQALAEMAEKYGPVISLRLGSHRAVVVSRLEEAKACFVTHDRALASRPTTTATKYMC